MRPFAIAGDAYTGSPTELVRNTSCAGPALITNVSPSSLVRKIRSSNATADAVNVAGTGTRPPSFLAGGRIVRNHRFGARGDELVVIADPYQERRRPASPVGTRRSPDFPAGRAIERDDEGAGTHFLIALENHQILVQHRRRAR